MSLFNENCCNEKLCLIDAKTTAMSLLLEVLLDAMSYKEEDYPLTSCINIVELIYKELKSIRNIF